MACGYENRDSTVSARVPTSYSLGDDRRNLLFCWPLAHSLLFPCQLPGSSAVPKEEEAASAFGYSLQEKLLPSLGSDTNDVPLKIKPGLLPAPSGRLLIS